MARNTSHIEVWEVSELWLSDEQSGTDKTQLLSRKNSSQNESKPENHIEVMSSTSFIKYEEVSCHRFITWAQKI